MDTASRKELIEGLLDAAYYAHGPYGEGREYQAAWNYLRGRLGVSNEVPGDLRDLPPRPAPLEAEPGRALNEDGHASAVHDIEEASSAGTQPETLYRGYAIRERESGGYYIVKGHLIELSFVPTLDEAKRIITYALLPHALDGEPDEDGHVD